MGKNIKQTGRGGARNGAGRKPLADPKVPITIYVETSIITSMGGIDAVRDKCYGFLQKKNDKPSK